MNCLRKVFPMNFRRRFALVGVATLSSVVILGGTVSPASASPAPLNAVSSHSAAVPAAAPARYILTAAEMGDLMSIEENIPTRESVESGKSGKIVLYSGTSVADGSTNVGAVGVLYVSSKNWLSGVRKFAKKQGFVETYSTTSVWEGTYSSGGVTLSINFINIGDNITTMGMAGGSYLSPMIVASNIAMGQQLKLAKNGWGNLA